MVLELGFGLGPRVPQGHPGRWKACPMVAYSEMMAGPTVVQPSTLNALNPLMLRRNGGMDPYSSPYMIPR